MRTRPDLVTLIAVAEFVTSALLLLLSCIVLFIAAPAALFTARGPGNVFSSLFVLGLVLSSIFGLGIASAAVGWGLLQLRNWARIGAMALAVTWLVGFPIWTVAGILVLIYLMGGEAKSAFGVARSPERAAAPSSPPVEPPSPPAASEVAAPSREAPASKPAQSPAEETREMRPEDLRREDRQES